jgi:hypothetical protein
MGLVTLRVAGNIFYLRLVAVFSAIKQGDFDTGLVLAMPDQAVVRSSPVCHPGSAA